MLIRCTPEGATPASRTADFTERGGDRVGRGDRDPLAREIGE
jgi:hypothetical protein